MNRFNLIAVVLLCLGCFLCSLALLFGGLPLLEGMDTILARPQDSHGSPGQGMPTMSAGMFSLTAFCFLGLPGVFFVSTAVSLWWFLGRARQERRPASTWKIYAGQLAGLSCLVAALVPVLWMLPMLMISRIAWHPGWQGRFSSFLTLEHPVSSTLLLLQMAVSVPIAAGASLLFLTHTDLQLRLRTQPRGLSPEARSRRWRANLRWERLCLLLLVGVSVSLVAMAYLIYRNISVEYLSLDRSLLSDQEIIALEPEAYVSGMALLAIPGMLCAFLAAGVRLVFIRPLPRATQSHPGWDPRAASLSWVSSPTGALRVPATTRSPESAARSS